MWPFNLEVIKEMLRDERANHSQMGRHKLRSDRAYGFSCVRLPLTQQYREISDRIRNADYYSGLTCRGNKTFQLLHSSREVITISMQTIRDCQYMILRLSGCHNEKAQLQIDFQIASPNGPPLLIKQLNQILIFCS